MSKYPVPNQDQEHLYSLPLYIIITMNIHFVNVLCPYMIANTCSQTLSQIVFVNLYEQSQNDTIVLFNIEDHLMMLYL